MTDDAGLAGPSPDAGLAGPPPAPPTFAVAPSEPVLGTGPAAGPQTVPAVVGVRQLIGTSFDLLLSVGEPMRRASFYIGVLVLGTVGPLALALWGMVVVGYPIDAVDEATWAPIGGWIALLGLIAFVGVVVASIESQAVVMALLGSHVMQRPITVREAVQRSRMVFWSVVGATLVVTIPISIIQNLIGQDTQQELVAGFVLGTALQAPFVYATAGIVLGGVGAVEALKRSVRIVRARKAAAIVLALLPAAFGLLILIAFEAGIDLAVRSMEALGLGTDSGPAGLAVLTVLIVGLAFAAGTLLLTASGIIYAPQVVMFVGLTHATMGLDHVRPGGDNAVEWIGPRRRRFRWLTRPMLLGVALGGIGLAALLATVSS